MALLQAVGATRYVVRIARNTPYGGRTRPPTRGALIRPLPRTYKGRRIPATPPDSRDAWQEGVALLCAEVWDALVLPEPRHREPQLIASTAPAIPTGFWDRQPQPTPGRLRRCLARPPFPHDFPLPAHIREKAAVTSHLSKGFFGQRRREPSAATPPTTLADAA